ncbi:MAG TPA: hypothetical protein VI168_18165 [Croceibacterium sp.]
MSRRRAVATLAIAASLLSLAAPAGAERVSAGHQKSWGKGGVSLEQYWVDSAECAHAAAEMDLDGTSPAKALQLATRMSEQWGYGGDILQIARVAPLDVQFNRAATIMEDALESCLVERGYVKFELTDDQDAMLSMLEYGSTERRAYLHSLASDPGVLATQAVMES